MNALKIQGLIFSLAALLVAAFALVFTRPNSETELISFAALTLLLGVPHGALDPIFARQLYGVKGYAGWARFALVYVSVCILLLALWLVTPTFFLVIFLIASVAHFSGDLPAHTALPSRVLYGGAIIILPTIFYATEVTSLIGFLIGADAAKSLVAALRWIAWPWLVGLVMAAGLCLRTDMMAALEIMAVGTLALVAPPIVAFTVFFCAMHSARHILRTHQYAGPKSAWRLVGWSLLPMLAVCIALLVAWASLHDAPFDSRVVQIAFVTLAVLTGPHMVLIEQVRLTGWVKGN